jgi:uroporphyrinogen decarboxylase
MTKKERILCAIDHKIPDKLPKGELGIAKEVADGILGREYPEKEREILIRDRLNIDLISVGNWGKSTEIGRDVNGNIIYRNAYGYDYIASKHDKKLVRPAVKDPEDVKNFKAPTLDCVDLSDIEYYTANTDMFVFAASYGPECIVYDTIGFENYMEYSVLNTKEMEELTVKYIEFEILKIKKMIDLGADGVIICDDIAYNSGPFISPKFMDILVYPYFKQMIKEIKQYKSLPVFLHTDGNLNTVFEKILECGFDGIQSLQPSAGMNIGEIKKRYGKDICLMGNIDLDYILPFGSTDLVRDTVKKTIEEAAYGGGFILSSCNILTDAVKPENAITMYDTAEEYRYNVR